MTLLPLLLACIKDVSPGPDPGACADLPEGVYTFGDIGIGSCLAGPSDLRFFQQDGGTFVGITNADPYRMFRTGSVLVIDWDDLQARLDDEPPSLITMDELKTFTLEILDDDDDDGIGNNPFLGGFGYLPASQTAVVTSRLSEDGVLRAGRDEAYLIDLSRMELGAGMELAGELTLEDDPQPVVVDDEEGRIYVGNLSDHSVSVLEEIPSDGGLPVKEIDVAVDASTSRADFDDLDASGSFAELTELSIGDVRALVRDRFTLTFVDGTIRLWVPTPVNEETVGIVRWSSGGGAYTPSPFGFEEGLGTVLDPFAELGEDGLPVLWYGREDGTIRRAVGNFLGGSWLEESEPVREGGQHASPSAAPLPEGVGLWTDFRENAGEPASIHLSLSPDGLEFDDLGAVLEPPPGSSYEDPYTVYDAGASRYRTWLSVREGDRWFVALSESTEGTSGWSTPVPVIELDGSDVAAPSVALLDGRYGMWTAVSDGTTWQHAFSWSYDGWTWTDPVVVAPSELPFDPASPPRAAVQASNIGGWRFEGVDQGQLPSLLAAGTSGTVQVLGLDLEIASGHEVKNNVVQSLRGELGLVPNSVAEVDGRTLLYATATGSAGHARIVVLELVDGEWTLAVDPEALEQQLGRRPGESLSHPLVVPDGDRYVLFATLLDDEGARLVRSSSSDGLSFEPVDRALVLADEGTDWDAAGAYAHSIQRTAQGVVLWYTGNDGSRLRIGSALAPDLDGRFVRQLGLGEEWQFGTGLPGSFDDTEVAAPLVIELEGRTHLYYAGFDGIAWHLGHAELVEGSFVRRTDPVNGLSVPSMNGIERSFSAAGVEAPTLLSVEADGGLRLLYAGRDASGLRLGLAGVPPGSPEVAYARQRFPTAGDTVSFSSTDGVYGEQVIELAQATQWFVTNGFGMSSMTHDPDRGFLYVTSKLSDDFFVLDVRDDSTGDFDDANALDLEALVRIDAGSTGSGFRDSIISPSRGLLYLTQRLPEALVVVDLNQIQDDDTKAPVDRAVAAVLPFPDSGEDLGADTLASIGGAGMALTDDERLLVVTHFRQNAVSVLDLERESFGSEIAWIPNVGENPHVVRISPDQRYAVVANYVGSVTPEGEVSSSLAVIDLDPSSERFLEVVTWIANR